MLPFLRFWRLRGSECVFGQWRGYKKRGGRGERRILGKNGGVGRRGGGGVAGVVVGKMDPAVKAGDDFFRYCNGAWLARTEIPADRPSISVFATLVDKSSQRVRGLIDEAVAANAPAGTNARKIADLYKSFMDEAGH